MNQGRMTFTQIIDFASQDIFKVCVKRYNGNYKAKEFSCWKQFLCLAFGQLTHRESMSDTMLCLKLNADKLYHLGIGKVVNKSSLSRANEKRDWRIFQDFGLKLIEEARILYDGGCTGEAMLGLWTLYRSPFQFCVFHPSQSCSLLLPLRLVDQFLPLPLSSLTIDFLEFRDCS